MALINISPLATKEDKLQDISDYLEELKHELGTVIDEYEDEGASEDTLDTFTEVLDAMEDAVDGIFDVLEEE